jgi:hypothetical protein
MSLYRAALPLLLLVLLPGTSASQAAASPEEEVRGVVRRLFDGMRSADSAMVRSTFAPGVRFASVNVRKSPAAVEYEQPDGWLAAIARSGKRWDERVYEVRVQMDDGMAQVWAPYAFYVDGKLRHCGVDAMELLRDAGGWKITQLSDTRRQEGCREVPSQ